MKSAFIGLKSLNIRIRAKLGFQRAHVSNTHLLYLLQFLLPTNCPILTLPAAQQLLWIHNCSRLLSFPYSYTLVKYTVWYISSTMPFFLHIRHSKFFYKQTVFKMLPNFVQHSFRSLQKVSIAANFARIKKNNNHVLFRQSFSKHILMLLWQRTNRV